jgi:EAL domain-containing protein (putative c-di-GMP-specific phosphodiesterase class I)
MPITLKLAPSVPARHEPDFAFALPLVRSGGAMHPSEVHAVLTGTMIETRYQPIVRLADRTVVAVEVLARLNHPARGMLLPHHFVPQIEDAGQAAALTETVARRAFAEMAAPALAPLQFDIALNLPLDVLLVPQALTLLDIQRRREGIAAERVIIELTESQPVEDVPGLKVAISRLRDAGYEVVIDDVEPKVPLLEALLDLPFTGIKLDKSLVKRIADDRASHDFSARMVKVAKARGMTTTAEGVEDASTWDRLAGMGVDHAQGFLVARALTAAAIPSWIRRWSKRPASG